MLTYSLLRSLYKIRGSGVNAAGVKAKWLRAASALLPSCLRPAYTCSVKPPLIDTGNHCQLETRLCGCLNRDLLTFNRAVLTCGQL